MIILNKYFNRCIFGILIITYSIHSNIPPKNNLNIFIDDNDKDNDKRLDNKK